MDTASVVTIIGAIFGGIVLLMNTWATMQTRLTTQQTKETVTSLQADTAAATIDQNKQLEVIHKNGNDHLALLTEKLASSEKKYEEMIAGVNAGFEKRIQELEAKLVAKDSQISRTAAQGSAEAPMQVEIKQPEDDPVPVKQKR